MPTILSKPVRGKPVTDNERLAELIRAVERGQSPTLDDLERITASTDRATAGSAKRLLAHLSLQEAGRRAQSLLFEACADLDFRYPAIMHEAITQAEARQDFDAIFDLRVSAATRMAERNDIVPALVQLLNAAAEDFRHGARHANTPESIGRMVHCYERAASAAQSGMGIVGAARGVRRSPTGGKLRLAHVAAQLVDGSHSTSRAVNTLLKHADRQRFDVFLFITDALGPHEQHAGQCIGSDWTEQRGPRWIGRFQNKYGVPVVLPRSRASCVTAAADLHRRMAEMQIDVAFFHGSLATPTDWLLCAWQAAPWQFDRAFGGPLFCPQVDYQFFEFAGTMERLAFLCRERGIAYGPLRFGGVDLSHVTTAQPISRRDLNVADDHVLLATLGMHLPSRMSDAFCRTVGEALRRNPNCTYLVIGPGDFERQRAIFGDLCGATPRDGRIRFIGPSTVSDRVAQTIDVYVNEYPNGGGVAIGEAMAAGKPVVCMQAGDSSLSMAGAFYVGRENLVEPATDEAFAARLTQLIREPAERRGMGEKMLARYHAEFDGRKLTQDETERIWQVIHGLPPTGIA